METHFDSLPVDILLHLFNYMNEKDCLTFSISGVSDRFSCLWGERRNLSIHQCFFVTHNSFRKYLSRWVCPEMLTSLDTSHCYWLPSDFLFDVVTSMSHLVALKIQDTKLNMSHLWQIFKSCHHIVKLSISLSEYDEPIFDKMKEFESPSLQTLSNGFSKLTHLKILAFNGAYYTDSWLLILQLLSYCRKCVDLHLEIVYSHEDVSEALLCGHDESVNRARDEFFPNLSWMALLKNFIILKRGETIICQDLCVKELVEWVFSHYDMNCIERVWIMENDGIMSYMIPSESQLKSILCCNELSSFDCDGDGPFKQLQHIGGRIGLEHWGGLLPNLRYVYGYCISSQGVDELCRAHPKLEHLHLDDNDVKYPFCMKADWMLNHLKTLVYTCGYPIIDILEPFLKAAPNLEVLHIGLSNRTARSPWTTVEPPNTDFLKTISRCGRLTTLRLNAFNLFEGDFFETIFSSCPLLRNLHICGGLTCAKSFENLCRYLPLAEKLRDFRLQYDYDSEYLGENPNRAVLNALLYSKRLERIVLYEEVDDGSKFPWKSQELQDVLFKFVSSMPDLVCFCFITASEIEPGTVAELKKKFYELIVPIRPAFWCHVQSYSLPSAWDPTVPRIHYDEIVCPINYLVPEF
ncbi:uncharacterized protein LOC124199716 isoform X2 [Daphnia pulex]|uniref:uncharacterized protein LOC124199716 isoform X2 n=1 Tax=Daphnia pulex TaxID=6669 RepID=UPI001EDC977D|nr:uncharacterized protein LOC124199716 isoform X2 [Daphnia pulex]